MLARKPTAALALLASTAMHASVFVAFPRAPAPRDVAPIELDLVAPVVEPEPPVVAVEPEGPATAPPRATRERSTPAVARAATLPAAPAAASVVAGEAPSEPMRFVMNVVPATSTTARAGPSAAPAAEAPGDAVYTEEGVDARPRLLDWQAPRYPASAASAGVEVDVPVDVVIDTEGNVTEARLPKHFGYGLDEAAGAAARSYHFSRGIKAGRPVRVRMRCTVMFRLN
jgi:TonB family protein